MGGPPLFKRLTPPGYERDIEAHLIKRVKALGGEVRKVQWVGRRSAPDRLVMLPAGRPWCQYELPAATVWVELKALGKAATFPADERERAQAREHARMRALGQDVRVIDSKEAIDEWLS